MVYSLLVLYVTQALGMTDNNAYAISAAFNALAFVTSLPAGFILERCIGFRLGAIVSSLLCFVGLCLIAMKSTIMLYIGLGFFVAGTGMSLPCLYVILGNLYPKNHIKRENGFVLAYIGMNLGGFMASGASGTIANSISYSAAYIIGAVAMLLMLPIIMAYWKLFKDSVSYSNTKIATGFLLSALLVIVSIILCAYASTSNFIMLILGGFSLMYVLFVAKCEHTKEAKRGMIIFALLTTVSVIFWTLYNLSPSLLTIFTERNVDRVVLGYQIPTADLSGLNPFFIVVFGIAVTYILGYVKKKGVELSYAVKFGIGQILMGLGFIVLSIGIYYHTQSDLVLVGWLVLSYLLQTLGELFVGPIGFAMVGDMVPATKVGVMMGIWQLSCGFAGALSEYLAKYATPSTKNISLHASNNFYAHSFNLYGGVTIAVGVVLLLISPMIKKFLTV